VKAMDSAPSPTAKWDQQTVERVMRLIRPFLNGWNGHMNGSLARALGFRPVVPTVYQAAADGSL
jgi:hypothetical protein